MLLALKAIFLFVYVAGGGAYIHPAIRRYLKRHITLQRAAIAMGAIGALYFVAGLFVDVEGVLVWGYQRITIGRYLDRDFSTAECDKQLNDKCVRYGGIRGDSRALSRIRECSALDLIPSSSPILNWTSLWITNVYSYAPGGGGPGGGLLNDVLKIGGWGDVYFSLVKFELPLKTEMAFAGVLFFVQNDEQEPTPLFVDRVIEPWKWDLTQHIWWKDRPGGAQITSETLPPPEKLHWYVIDITKLYNQWGAGATGDYGFQIRPSSNFGSMVVFTNNIAADKTRIPYLLLCNKS